MDMKKMTPEERALIYSALKTDDPKERSKYLKEFEKISPQYHQFLQEHQEEELTDESLWVEILKIATSE